MRTPLLGGYEIPTHLGKEGVPHLCTFRTPNLPARPPARPPPVGQPAAVIYCAGGGSAGHGPRASISLRRGGLSIAWA